MNRNVSMLFAAATLTMLAACATPTSTATKSAATDDDDKVLVTGSRIPVKDRTSVKSVESRTAIDQMMERSSTQPTSTR